MEVRELAPGLRGWTAPQYVETSEASSCSTRSCCSATRCASSATSTLSAQAAAEAAPARGDVAGTGPAFCSTLTYLDEMDAPLAILYEHPLWFEPLFCELDRRGVEYEKLRAAELVFDPGEQQSRYSLLFNRMSPSAWTRGHTHAIFHSLHFLAHLEAIGADTVNRHGAFQVELSKARQCALFAGLGVRYPSARAVSDPARVPTAAEGLEFPVLVKPNIGGSGAGIRAFGTPAELQEAAAGRR